MEKRFNVTGTCIPEKHYMVDISNKLDSILKLVNNEEYFIINRPRQYGKTTTLYMLEKRLNRMEEYLPIKISFEAIDTEGYSEVKKFLSSIMMQIVNYFRFSTNKEMYKFIKNHENKITTMNEFNSFITDLIEFAEKKVVLIIDEVDKSSNNQLFLDFLGMLRSKYLLRNEGRDYTFHSVILAGVHDVKTLKLKIRSDEEHKYNSPWNIASDFDVEMSFSIDEIKTMLDDYVENKKVDLDKEYFGEKLYFYTSGYPFLVSKLCKIIDEKIMPKNELKWEKEYLELAVKELLKDSNTNFDSLIKNIENNKDLQELVRKIILDGYEITYNQDNSLITMGIIYGIFKNSNGKVKIHNRIYEQRIYNYMISLIETKMNLGLYNEREKYLNKDGTLNIKKVLLKFQEFMKHEYSQKREAFLEEDGRLVFLAFLSPIINGSGFAFKEVKGGEEKRFDIVITYNKKMYILELKIWRGEEYHKKGLIQLGEYLHQYGLEEGYLLIFDFRKAASLIGIVEETYVDIEEHRKKIIEVYC
ncbi:AAA family ATPase [Clostridium sporogenes]|uniref:AAA family ATPase n=1 Tax=Clostridium sporogenes TaxID=1509 RepID=UPI002902A70E|nr:AAA family ATPase [Clostridium botulinum]